MPRVSVFLPFDEPMSDEFIMFNLLGRNAVLNIAIETWKIVKSTWVNKDSKSSKLQGHFVVFRLPQASLDLLFSQSQRPNIFWMFLRATVSKFGSLAHETVDGVGEDPESSSDGEPTVSNH